MIKTLNNNEISFVLVTLSYWFFMLTDGALRMLVLLHFHTLGFSPLQLAYLFLLYEFFGMVTNLTAGWIAKKIGLNITLFSGMIFQIVSLLLLTQVDKSWSITSSVIFVMATQGLSGIAKDLTKMSSKSSVKLLAPDKNNKLFQWVTLMTGSSPNEYVSQFKPCAITNVSINYTPDGSWSAYQEGAPVATQLTVQFKELKMLFAEDINEGGKSF